VHGQMTPGTRYSFVPATLMLYGPVRQLSRSASLAQQTAPSADRVFEILAQEPAVADRRGARLLDRFRETIEFDHVWFQYDDGEKVLKDISLVVRKGGGVALGGGAGGGKMAVPRS